MRKGLVFAVNAAGWFLLMLAMLFGAVRDVGLDPQLYFDLQTEAGILPESGISEADLLQLDVGLARYLGGEQDDLEYEIEVFGSRQSAFNGKELHHMADCRKLFAPLVSLWLNLGMALAGTAMALYAPKGRRVIGRGYIGGIWLASMLIIAPLALLGLWAAMDFTSAFHFFHRLLFTNNLWLLDPRTDLLIRICPSSMFAGMGIRIGVRAALALLGLPAVLTLIYKLEKRKRKKV